jgi:hypothetical protein
LSREPFQEKVQLRPFSRLRPCRGRERDPDLPEAARRSRRRGIYPRPSRAGSLPAASPVLSKGKAASAGFRPQDDDLPFRTARLEAERSISLDKTADTFARILSAAAEELHNTEQSRPLEQLLYHIGRWIYLADAFHDRKKDAALGVYNPVLARFASGPDIGEETRNHHAQR